MAGRSTGGEIETGSAETEVGARLRSAREGIGLSLRELARRVDISPSALSQIETGKSRPSVKTLYSIVSELGLSMDGVFAESKPGNATATVAPRLPADGASRGPVVQNQESRASLELDSGVTWARLTPAPDPHVDFLFCTYEPGGSSSDSGEKLTRHIGFEYGIVLSGELELSIGFDQYLLRPGDSCAYNSSEPHRLSNPGTEVATAIWFVLGRQLDDPRQLNFGD